MGFQLLTSTGEFTGFLNHQQYNSFFPSPTMTGSHGPYSDTSGGNSEEDSSLSSWHFGTSFLGPICWWLVGGKKLVGITPSVNEPGNGTSPFLIGDTSIVMFVVEGVDPCMPKLLLGGSFGVIFVVLVLMFFF